MFHVVVVAVDVGVGVVNAVVGNRPQIRVSAAEQKRHPQATY